jgi:hypothetical protein
LEEIFRLLEYLNIIGKRDDFPLDKHGYSQRFEHDSAVWELKVKISRLQSRIAETYLLTIEDITPDERRKIQSWLNDGFSVYDNPYMLYDEYGRTMDFINASRFNTVLYGVHFCSLDTVPDTEGSVDDLHDDPPF